ncbi:MAG: SDR family oxidoreductase [Maritimibacter sp.]
MTKYLVTGASGQLGALTLQALATRVSAADIVTLTRKEADQKALADQGFDARLGDYSDPASLGVALQGVDRLLLISSNEIGQRAPQHRAVIDAAQAAGVSFIAYTSILSADKSPMALAGEHLETEQALAASGIAHTVLRNGWYSENITMTLGQDLELGQHFGAAGEGVFATAPRADYAEAAAIVLATPGHEGKTYELAGDAGFRLADYAKTASDITGKPIAYSDMPEAAFKAALIGAGLPEGMAGILADSDAKAKEGWLNSASNDLSALIGRPTTPLAETIRAALG